MGTKGQKVATQASKKPKIWKQVTAKGLLENEKI